MKYLHIFTLLAVIISFLFNRKKTFLALKVAVKKMKAVFLTFMGMLLIISVVLYIVPDTTIIKYLGNGNIWMGNFFAIVFGSITLLPGFIAFPLTSILLFKGVPYMVLSAFTTSLMMVGILTFPLEKKYLGVRVAVVRNVIGLIITISVALVTGVFYGEFL